MKGFRKVKTNYIDAVEVRELKETHYYLVLGNTASSKAYIFMVSKTLFDDCYKSRKIVEPEVKSIAEAEKENLKNIHDVS